MEGGKGWWCPCQGVMVQQNLGYWTKSYVAIPITHEECRLLDGVTHGPTESQPILLHSP